MRFQFDIHLSDEDYFKFNRFYTLYSPYGKKQALSLKLTVLLITLVFCVLSLLYGDFSREAWLGIIPMALAGGILFLFFDAFLVWTIKQNIKKMKKKGKLAYPPVAMLAFDDERFAEITPDEKSETKYTKIERVSIVAGEAIYLHVSSVGAHILPDTAFASHEERQAFVTFLADKCENIDLYAKKGRK